MQRLAGLLTPENVGERVMIHGALRPDEPPAWSRRNRHIQLPPMERVGVGRAGRVARSAAECEDVAAALGMG